MRLDSLPFYPPPSADIAYISDCTRSGDPVKMFHGGRR
jgi:hypothetical protein